MAANSATHWKSRNKFWSSEMAVGAAPSFIPCLQRDVWYPIPCYSVPLAVKMRLVPRCRGSIEYTCCVLLPIKSLSRMTGYFLLPPSQLTAKGGQKRAGTEETLGSHSCLPYRSHPHPIWSWQSPRISEKGFHPYEEQNNHLSWTRSPKYPLPSSKQD